MIAASKFDMESSKYMGIDAVKKLRLHYNINKVGELSISPSFFLFLIFPHQLFITGFPTPPCSPLWLPSSLFFFLLSHKPPLLPSLTLSYHFCRQSPEEQNRCCWPSLRRYYRTHYTTQTFILQNKQCCYYVDQCWLFFVDNLDQCAVSVMPWGGQGEVCSNCGTHYRSCKTDQRRGVCHIIESGWGYCFQLTWLILVAVVAAIMVFLKIWLNTGIHENQFLIIDFYKSLWKCYYS